MKLRELLNGLNYRFMEGMDCPDYDTNISALCFDNRAEVPYGAAFVCIKGTKYDTHDFADEAFRKGAACVIAEHEVDVERFLAEKTQAEAAMKAENAMKEVVKALASLIFDELHGTTFHYSCFKENTASAALCESLGFTYINTVKKLRTRDNLEYDSAEYELKKTF